jgi:hypothetical protein
MKSKLIAVSAAAIAALFVLASSVEQAAAQRGGRDGGGPSAGGGRGPSGGPFMGGGRGPSAGPSMGRGRGPSAGPAGPRFDGRGPSGRSFSRGGAPGYGYAPRFNDRDGRRHVRRFRGNRFIYGAVPFYGAYEYGPCTYYYERAVATGSGYWWDRYYACAGGDYD